MPQVILVHGWGSGPDFWDALIPHLSPWPVQTINLGFTGPEKAAIETDNASVFITHSLGTMWALKNRFPRIKALIAINGFYCFRHFICRRTLETMRMRLKRNPIPQMDKFWESCGIGPGNPAGLDLQKLQEGLEWLISWNSAKELDALAVPVLSLAGQADPILAPDLMKKQWNGFPLRMVQDGGHALPQTHSAWCADHIREFLHGIGVER